MLRSWRRLRYLTLSLCLTSCNARQGTPRHFGLDVVIVLYSWSLARPFPVRPTRCWTFRLTSA